MQSLSCVSLSAQSLEDQVTSSSKYQKPRAGVKLGGWPCWVQVCGSSQRVGAPDPSGTGSKKREGYAQGRGLGENPC